MMKTELMELLIEATFMMFSGIFGHVARGVVFGTVGDGIFCAAIQDDRQGRGIDGRDDLAHASARRRPLGIVALGRIGFVGD